MRLNITLLALCCLYVARLAMAAEIDPKPSAPLQYKSVFEQYQKFDHGAASSTTDAHAGHEMHHDHDAHVMHAEDAAPHEPMLHDEHAEHQHTHGELQ